MSKDTPASSKTERKRFLSSPMDSYDPKKNKAALGASPVEEITAEMSQPVTNISLSHSDLQQISDLLSETFQNKMAGMIGSIVDGVLSGLKSQINELQVENTILKDRVANLEAKADKAEQYSRRNCIRISGVEETKDENTDDKVLSIAKDLGVDLSLEEIDRTHRIGKRPMADSKSRPRDIIVKFATFRSRTKLYKQKSKLKESSRKSVFLNEDLTRERNQIFFEARKLVMSKKATSTWTTDGVIIVRDNNMKIHRVETRNEFLQMLSKIGVSV